ncbi:MAG: GNAT family N-acetyltransferase [Candidatus Thorarchaeota archaeon]
MFDSDCPYQQILSGVPDGKRVKWAYMQFRIREWNREEDMTFFDYCQLEAFKTTLPNADALSEAEILQKYKEFDEQDPLDMSSPEYMVFIAETMDATHAGLVWLRHREPFWRFTEPLTWIYNVYVIPKFRRQGLARLFLEKTDEWTKEEGLHLIGLHVLERNVKARALYESSGYSLAARHNESCFYEKRLNF